ncbi:hypothetical protein O0L34_g17212 [Tuta absoluta]|nr:hypothetical protein O0L34_g17212 [Tuta absoluta]
MLEKLLLLTGLTVPLCKTDENNGGWENRPFTTIWPEKQQKSAKGTDVKKIIKKKPRRRTAFTTEQIRSLENVFNTKRYIDREQREQLAASLGIHDKCIKFWFQNRRMKEKRVSESSCDTSIESTSTAGSPANVPTHSDAQQEEQVESLIPEYIGEGNAYNAKSQYQIPESQYYLPESVYQPPELQYQLPQMQYQLPESQYQLPESQYQSPESQYQLPNGYYGAYNQYYGSSNNMPPNNTFYNDTSVYPTQYYPNSGTYNTEVNIQPQNYASYLNEINYYEAITME